MARRHAAEKRPAQPDSRYGNPVFGKFINAMMWDGKKSVSESVLVMEASIDGSASFDGFAVAASCGD